MRKVKWALIKFADLHGEPISLYPLIKGETDDEDDDDDDVIYFQCDSSTPLRFSAPA
jgi:hypothetical protein